MGDPPSTHRAKRAIARLFPGVGKVAGAVLMYHSVGSDHPYSLPSRLFESHLKFLSENYSVVLASKIGESIGGEKEIAKGSVALSFDDGYRDNADVVVPLLQKYEMCASFFICTGLIAGDSMAYKNIGPYGSLPTMTKGQISGLQNDGMEIGAHTVTHPRMSELSSDELMAELTDSKSVIQDWIGDDVRSLAYPFGQRRHIGQINDMLISNVGYQYGYTTEWNRNNTSSNRLEISRIEISPWDSVGDLRAKLNGNWDYVRLIHRIRNWAG